MNENVNGNIQALRCAIEDLRHTPPTYSAEYLEELAAWSDKLAELVIILRDFKERKVA